MIFKMLIFTIQMLKNRQEINYLWILYVNIVQYTTNRTPNIRIKEQKNNAWQAVAQALEMDVSSVQKRYNTIRSNFSKYLKDIKGKSGSGRDEIEILPDLEHLRWLITHI